MRVFYQILNMYQNPHSFRFLDKKSQSEIISLISTLDKTKITPNNVHFVLIFALRFVNACNQCYVIK